MYRVRGFLGINLSSDFKLVYPPTLWHLVVGGGDGGGVGRVCMEVALCRAAEGI